MHKSKIVTLVGELEVNAVKSQFSTLQDEQTVMLGLKNVKYIRFQINNGASVNVLPVQSRCTKWQLETVV